MMCVKEVYNCSFMLANDSLKGFDRYNVAVITSPRA